MNSKNQPGYWNYPPYSHPNPTRISGQNYGYPPQYDYRFMGYPAYPGWNPYQQPMGYWPSPTPHQAQTSSAMPMMPPNADPYQNNVSSEEYTEVWESPQSPQSPWIRAYEKHEGEGN